MCAIFFFWRFSLSLYKGNARTKLLFAKKHHTVSENFRYICEENAKYKLLFAENSTDVVLKSRSSLSCQIWLHWHETSHFYGSCNGIMTFDWTSVYFTHKSIYGFRRRQIQCTQPLFYGAIFLIRQLLLPVTHVLLCSTEKIKPFRFGTTWAWFNFHVKSRWAPLLSTQNTPILRNTV